MDNITITYSIKPIQDSKSGGKYTLDKYTITEDEAKEIIKTHLCKGYWSRNPHDWMECDVPVNIYKITKEKL